MQRAVVGAPGMSDGALAFYQDLFQKIYDSEKWQGYMEKKSLMGAKLDGSDLKEYWVVQRDRHEAILKASGAIK
jgi:tripartite-type tricarboxylate transporter receptor subunit TctC